MTEPRVVLSEIDSACVSRAVPYAVVSPPSADGADAPLPLCLALHGGGGSRESLVQLAPLLDRMWREGALPPMAVAMPSADPMCFYFDAPNGPKWESFVTDEWLPRLRRTLPVRGDRAGTSLLGWSMGGHGALKIAFRRPSDFVAVAAVQPLLEAALRPSDVPPRNRIHYVAGGPPALIGDARDPAQVEANDPAHRARANAAAIRASGLAIYVDAAGDDLLNAHDGAELLHRVLWDLDVSHEYHLVRGADHVGPTVPTRTREALAWLGAAMVRADEATSAAGAIGDDERAWIAWLERGAVGQPPPAIDARSEAFVRVLRAQLAPVRARAAAIDPTTLRRFGLLPRTRDDA